MTQKEKDLQACKNAIQNSYLRCLYGDAQLAMVFFEGMKYGKTGEITKSLLEDDDFLNNKHEKDKI